MFLRFKRKLKLCVQIPMAANITFERKDCGSFYWRVSPPNLHPWILPAKIFILLNKKYILDFQFEVFHVFLSSFKQYPGSLTTQSVCQQLLLGMASQLVGLLQVEVVVFSQGVQITLNKRILLTLYWNIMPIVMKAVQTTTLSVQRFSFWCLKYHK